MLDRLKGLLTSQSNHSAVILFVIMVFAAKSAGIDVVKLGEWFSELLAVIATISAGLKVVIPDAPTIPPNTVIMPSAESRKADAGDTAKP